MELSDKSGWDAYAKLNSNDAYSKGVVDYSERWANLMEQEMSKGKKLEDVAEQTSHDADIDGITGFMYGAAVAGLARFWKHGDQLRRWHNLNTQTGNEGEIANANGGTLNPALLTIVIPRS